MTDLEAIRKRLSGLTPGPFKQRGYGVWTATGCKVATIVGAPQCIPSLASGGKIDNADFFTHAPQDIADLLIELERAETARKAAIERGAADHAVAAAARALAAGPDSTAWERLYAALAVADKAGGE